MHEPWTIWTWLWPWPRTLTLTLKQGLRDSDVKTLFLAFGLWPTTLTYKQNLAKAEVNLHTEYQGRRSNSSAVRGRTDRRTDATKYIISLLCDADNK